MSVSPSGVLRRKRDGAALSGPEIEFFIRGFVDGSVAPYQMGAFLMAVTLNGMTPEETASLTRVMVDSGTTLKWSGLDRATVDKHSTGGVGDLVSLPLAPLVAACGVAVPMISGRGLGHTGGTLDKLESIPGLRTDLDPQRFREVLEEAGFAMGGQTEDLAPADRRMYAMRDVTATVECIPLIVSSILSKKVAEGIDALVLDVKCGRGAFMKTESDALRLAGELVRVGTLMGKRVVAFVTDMEAPLGRRIGNALETRTALECLHGDGPPDITELVRTLGAAMLCLGGVTDNFADAQSRLDGAVADGSGRDRFRIMVEAQGGDGGVVEDPDLLGSARIVEPITASRGGYVAELDPFALGMAVVDLGGGRLRAEDTIDPSVGIVLHKTRGEWVAEGDVLAEVHASDAESAKAVIDRRVSGAFTLVDGEPEHQPLIRHLVTADRVTPWNGAQSWSL